jgi:hypothetical protein
MSTSQMRPPRLHVILRRESPVALVIRQGPTRTFCTIGWELAHDRFEIGQWCKHKLYPERGDISPDGKWHVYIALNGWRSQTKGTWSGLAKVPYLKCVKLWPKGDTWGGGGLIVAKADAPGLEPDPPLSRKYRVVLHSPQRRLERDGWQHSEKAFGDGWRLSKRLPRFGFVEQHALIAADGVVHDRSAWQWAEVDKPRSRVVFAEAGRICTVPTSDPLHEPKLLFDANGMTFEAVAAPYRVTKR